MKYAEMAHSMIVENAAEQGQTRRHAYFAAFVYALCALAEAIASTGYGLS